jgi:cytochrome c-type biogenesis protein CcmH/NrfF
MSEWQPPWTLSLAFVGSAATMDMRTKRCTWSLWVLPKELLNVRMATITVIHTRPEIYRLSLGLDLGMAAPMDMRTKRQSARNTWGLAVVGSS